MPLILWIMFPCIHTSTAIQPVDMLQKVNAKDIKSSYWKDFDIFLSSDRPIWSLSDVMKVINPKSSNFISQFAISTVESCYNFDTLYTVLRDLDVKNGSYPVYLNHS